MLLLAFLLLPAIVATVTQLNINDYILKIDEDILKSIVPKNNATDELDLSNLGLKSLDQNVFKNLTNVKILNLDNNSLSNLPEFLFSNLTNLEFISLANNELSSFNNLFVGLKSVRCLNISNNSLRHLGKGWLFGLTKSSEIITRGNEIDTISVSLFENPFVRKEKTPESSVKNVTDDELRYQFESSEDLMKNLSLKMTYNVDETQQPFNASIRVKVCINKGKVISLEHFRNDEILARDCSEVVVDYGLKKLLLRKLGISEFENGWYRMQDFSIDAINLDDNAIVRLTSQLLNDLPKGVRKVALRGNKIERLEKEIMKNEYLRELDLSNNFIREIENGALENMNLKDRLNLNGNRLKDTKFAFTLPKYLTELYICDNDIVEISIGSFSKLDKLVRLNLDGNNITEVHRQSLRGLWSLRYLTLANNGLRKINPGAFEDLTFLRLLDLQNNSMSSLEKDLFAGLDILLMLDISGNKFSKITTETMSGLPNTVHYLQLNYNGIRSLEVGSFDNVPILSLSLNGNEISKIDEGSFNLPHLRHLSLNNNLLSDVNGDSFVGLMSLKSLSLAGNGIKEVKKGFAKHLGSLEILDLTKNLIKTLNNGALYGLNKSGRSFVSIIDTPIELIQGGVFDDE